MGPNMTNGVDDLILKLKRITNSYDLSDTEPGPRAPLLQLMYAASRGTFLSGTLAQVPLNGSTSRHMWPLWQPRCGYGHVFVSCCLKFGYILIMRSKPLASSQTLLEIDLKGRFKWAEI